ncbi:MAG: cation:proton antiporter [Candidatus Woesearchaeota archaeon]
MDQLFLEIGVVIILATSLAYLSRLLKQPLIPAYIITGLCLGPIGLGLVKDPQLILTLSEIGIAFLLFVVGLELDFKRLKDIGMVASIGGTVQVFILFSLGFLAAVILNRFTQLETIYIGAILAFSSTMVVVKLLSDKKALDTLHGRIIIGILLMEDIFAIIAISTLATISHFSPYLVFISLFKAIAVMASAVLIGRFVFPPVFRFAAHSQELLFLMSLSVCFLFSIVANYIGFSIAIGGFIAGVTLGNLPYNIEIASRVKPLRDFFITLFFVSLGMQIMFANLGSLVLPLLIFMIFVIAAKPFIIMIVASLFGYTKRTSFLTAITLTQISEFSLIIMAQGLALNHISQEIFTFGLLLAVATMSLTPYLSKYQNTIYNALAERLRFIERIGEDKDLGLTTQQKYDVILIGYDRIGFSIAKTLLKMRERFLVVDYNPDIIKKLSREKTDCLYGDITDTEILERISSQGARIIVSTIPFAKENLCLIKTIKRENPKTVIFVTANKVEEALKLYDNGADYVILPHFLGGDHVAVMLEKVGSDINKLIKTKLRHIEELNSRKEMGHEHPVNSYKNDH